MNEEKIKFNECINKLENLFNEIENENSRQRRIRLLDKINGIIDENPEIFYQAPKVIEKFILYHKKEHQFSREIGETIPISRETPSDLIELIYENPKYFSAETIDSLLGYLFMDYGGHKLSFEQVKGAAVYLLKDERILRSALSGNHPYNFYWPLKEYVQEYFCDNFETIFKNFDPRTQEAENGLREHLVQGIVDQRIIINKDGNFQAKNDGESLDIQTAKRESVYELGEEEVQKIIKMVYKLDTFADVKNFYNNIDTILEEDMQKEGTVINSLCNCKTLGRMYGNFREADDIYGPNTQFEYLKSLAYSTIKDRLEEIKKDREKVTGNTKEKKAEIDNMFEGWEKNGEQK